jgi:hypothetical protein
MGNRTQRAQSIRPARFATMAKSSNNNTAVRYGLRFATLPKISQCFLALQLPFFEMGALSDRLVSPTPE